MGSIKVNLIAEIAIPLVMSYREQFIWKKSVDLSVKCYELTKNFPNSEVYGLTSQIRRASVSTASNIAEGYGRKTKAEYIQFLHIALGSLRELDTQLIIAQRVNLTKDQGFIPLLNEVEEMQKILVATINKLKN
ncbi:MAG: four helix bundle protein [Stenomitos frigidus ULC029]